MKTYAPKGLNGAQLRAILEELQATPADAAKFLHVTERSVWRWLADDSAPFPVLAALWHETPAGRYATALDVGNELAIHRGLARAHGEALALESARLARLVAIADTGAANDPLIVGPHQVINPAVGLVGAGLRVGRPLMQPAQVVPDTGVNASGQADTQQYL